MDKNKPKGERIAKYLSKMGYGSRREIEKHIFETGVIINGKTIKTPATFIEKEKDKIEYKGQIVEQKEIEKKIWLYYKPKGVITTHNDPQNRTTVFNLLRGKGIDNVISIGRLDYNSEGLLLITNCGKIARFMENPKNEIVREYKVRVFGKINPDMKNKIESGITIDKIKYKPAKMEIIDQKKSNFWIKIKLTEGKNREIRKIMEHFNLRVSRLIRIAYGDFNLGKLKPDEVILSPKGLGSLF